LRIFAQGVSFVTGTFGAMELPRPEGIVKLAALLSAAALLVGCGALRAPGSEAPPAATPSPTAPSVPVPAPPQKPSPSADAAPRVDRIARGAPNAPYETGGKTYEPERSDVPITQAGLASWYGKPFHGRQTASGEVYDMHAMSAAHKTMPLPSYARVRNPANGREVIVRINDRGPFKPGRIIDLSFAAAQRLRIAGVAAVEVTRLTHDEIRSGGWKQPLSRNSGKSVVAAAR
jgi:rare lipoprotein A